MPLWLVTVNIFVVLLVTYRYGTASMNFFIIIIRNSESILSLSWTNSEIMSVLPSTCFFVCMWLLLFGGVFFFFNEWFCGLTFCYISFFQHSQQSLWGTWHSWRSIFSCRHCRWIARATFFTRASCPCVEITRSPRTKTKAATYVQAVKVG